jgi:hypothetical protein
VTIDAAYSIQQEKRVGSIEVGKDANLSILEQSPYAVAPEKLKDIGVWGTMLEGRVQPVPAQTTGAAVSIPRNGAVSGDAAAALQRDVVAQLTEVLGHHHGDGE